jgi:hypothetical protein
MCDGSHALTPEQYTARSERLAALFNKPVPANQNGK